MRGESSTQSPTDIFVQLCKWLPNRVILIAIGFLIRFSFQSVLILAAALLLTGCAQKEPYAEVERRIRQLIRKENVQGVQVAAARFGEVIYEDAFGWSNRDLEIPATTKTRHLTASIDKTFTTTALMILAERGLVDLHGSVNDYLKNVRLSTCRRYDSPATVAQLLLHTSGFPYGYYICSDGRPLDQHRSMEDLIALCGVLVSRPGSRYLYSNFGYGLVMQLMEDILDEPVKPFIQREILEPLELTSTRFYYSPPPNGTTFAQVDGENVLPVSYDQDGYTALYSTAGDLVRWGLFHMKLYPGNGPAILSDSTINIMQKYFDPGSEFTSRRLAWYVHPEFGFDVLEHGGGGPGIHNRLYLIPSEQLAVAIVSNARYPNRSSDPVLKALISEAIRSTGGRLDHRFPNPPPKSWPVLDPAMFAGNWSGQISGPLGSCGISLSINRDGKPHIKIDGGPDSSEQLYPALRGVKRDTGTLLWRFEARIPYLLLHAEHDEVIITVWPEGEDLIGSASAAKEKNFGQGENYVLPQCLILQRTAPL